MNEKAELRRSRSEERASGESGARRPSENTGSSMFPETIWTLLLEPIKSRSPEAQAALESLCESYRRPLLTLTRLKLRNEHLSQAEDITHDFILSLLKRNDLARMDRRRGKFRTFLRRSLHHFILNWIRDHGRVVHVPLEEAPEASLMEADGADPAYDQAWAEAIVEQAMAEVADWYRRRRKTACHDVLIQLLPGADPSMTQAEAAAKLDISANQVRVEYHRLRERIGLAVRHQVAMTVSTPTDIDGELQHLKDYMGAGR